MTDDGLKELTRMPGALEIERLDNGLTVCLLRSDQAPLVTTALCYRVGARDEPPELAGVAHFLEHMMFKGSARYGAGEVDRRTRELGGSNNAFTSHDGTTYYFSFSSDRWVEALRMEADRMAGLTLDPDEVERERRVILEEVSMYEDDPWDALDQEVHGRFFGDHPYARPVIGTRESLRSIDRPQLERFHATWYRPPGAVLVVAGSLGGDALAEVEGCFASLPATGAVERPAVKPSAGPRRALRLERRQGDVARLQLALPSPGADDPDYAPLRLLMTTLAGPRSSRLAAVLVEDDQLCGAVWAVLGETQQPGMATVAAELLPGAEPAEVERRVLAEIDRLRDEPPSAAELERARRLLISDWVFGTERIHQQALVTGQAVALFDAGYPRRHLERILDCTSERLVAVAEHWLQPENASVTGWSLPEAG